MSLARGSAYDATFDPERAFFTEALWQAAPLEVLVNSRVSLGSAALSAWGRLSQGADVKATIAPATVTRAEAIEWPVTYADWAALQGALQQRFSGALTGGTGEGGPVLLAPAAHARASFDELLQEHTWPVADSAGRWIGLTLSRAEADEMTAARLTRLSRIGDVALILALPRPGPRLIQLVPAAVIAATPSVPKPKLHNLQFRGTGLEQPSASMQAAWIAGLFKKRYGAMPVEAEFFSSAKARATRRILLSLADELLGVAEIGGRPLDEARQRALVAASGRLDSFGLAIVSDAVRVVTADARPAPAALLRAVHLVHRALAMTRALRWLALRAQPR